MKEERPGDKHVPIHQTKEKQIPSLASTKSLELEQIKNRWLTRFLGLFTVVFLAVYLFVIDDLPAVIKQLKKVDYRWVGMGLGLIIIYWLVEALVLHLSLKKLYPRQIFYKTWRVSMIGQYFNGITPFASGGQPAQAYFLVRQGVPLGDSMTGLLSKFIIYQITLTIYCAAMIFIRFQAFLSQSKAMIIGVLVGFGIQVVVVGLLIGVAFFKSGTRRVTKWIIKLLGKMRIIRNPEVKQAYYLAELETFHEQFKFLLQHKKALVQMCVLTGVQLTAYFLIGNAVYRSFGLTGGSVFAMVASQAYILLIISFIPLPGAFFFAEGSFYLFFSTYFPEQKIALAIVMWRLITFYIPLLVGWIVTTVEQRRQYVRSSEFK